MDHYGTGDVLERYALGRLPDSDRVTVEEHLLICPACCDELEGIEAFAAGMKEALGTVTVPERPATAVDEWFAWLRRPLVSVALALVVVVVAMSVFSGPRASFAPAATLPLSATRGEIPIIVPARELRITLSDAPREGVFRVEIVDAAGARLWSGLAASSPAGVEVNAQKRLGPGDYFVRLYTVSGEVLREYGFRVRA